MVHAFIKSDGILWQVAQQCLPQPRPRYTQPSNWQSQHPRSHARCLSQVLVSIRSAVMLALGTGVAVIKNEAVQATMMLITEKEIRLLADTDVRCMPADAYTDDLLSFVSQIEAKYRPIGSQCTVAGSACCSRCHTAGHEWRCPPCCQGTCTNSRN